jgi:orotidine-5'-phosphate decarboxylase
MSTNLVSQPNAPTVFGASRTHGIIPALDVPDTAAVRRIVRATSAVPGVVGYKLGLATVLQLGLRAAVELIAELTDLPVLYDHQKAGLDVPSNAAVLARTLAGANIAAAVVFPVAGPTVAAEFVGALRAHGVVPVVGGLLPVADYTASGGGWVSDDVLADITRIALRAGETHLVVPATPQLQAITGLAADAGMRPRLFVPGITSTGAELGQLAAVAGRVAGIYPIVGRAVINADDPAAVAARLAELLDDAVGGRIGT